MPFNSSTGNLVQCGHSVVLSIRDLYTQMSERKNIVIPPWYPTYLALRRAGVNPYSECASAAALADIFASNEHFLTPCDGAELCGLYNSSLLGPLAFLDPTFLGILLFTLYFTLFFVFCMMGRCEMMRNEPTRQRFFFFFPTENASNSSSTQQPFTPLNVETNMHAPITQQYVSPEAVFGDFTKISAHQPSPRPSQPLRQPPPPPPPSRMYQENNAFVTEEDRNETRRIASRIHILHSQKLSPAEVNKRKFYYVFYLDSTEVVIFIFIEAVDLEMG